MFMRIIFHHHGRRQGLISRWMMRRLTKRLNLSSQQSEKFIYLSNTMHSTHTNINDMRAQRDKLLEPLLQAEQLDRDTALRILRLPQQEFNEHTSDIVNAFGDFYDELQPAQREKLLQLWKKNHQRHAIHN